MNQTPSQTYEMVYNFAMARVADWPGWLQAVISVLLVPLIAPGPWIVLWTIVVLTVRWFWRRADQGWQAEMESQKQERDRQRANWEAKQDRRQADWKRLREIEDQLWLESLSPESRGAKLRSRRENAERERRAQEILQQEKLGTHNGA